MKFNDGMTFDTSGALRVVHKRDGYYVMGNGMLIPVDSAEEGLEEIRILSIYPQTEEETK
jgi:hypothetical protein